MRLHRSKKAPTGCTSKTRSQSKTNQSKTNKSKGDQKVELKIVTPPDIDDRLRELLTEWRKTHAFDPRADLMKEASR